MPGTLRLLFSFLYSYIRLYVTSLMVSINEIGGGTLFQSKKEVAQVNNTNSWSLRVLVDEEGEHGRYNTKWSR